jgi:amino acid adenylation domain-containing protein
MLATVPELVRERAIVSPRGLAVQDREHALAYEDLERWSAAVAADLRGRGAGPESVVGLYLPRSARLAAAALGVLRAGAAYLPLDPDHPAERVTFMLQDAGCRLVLADPGRDVPAGPWEPIVVDGPPVEASPPEPLVAVDPGNLAYVIYTSGSTGRPKGVEISHRSLLHLCRWHQSAFSVTATDRASLLASPAFDAAVWELWPYLTAGASVHVPPEDVRREPERLRDWLLFRGITTCFLPTPLAEVAMTLAWPETAVLRTLLTGADTLHRRPGPELPFAVVNNYGPTECTVVATSGRVSAKGQADGLPSIGRPIAGARVHILDGDLGPLPVDVPGELCIGGAGVARGYRGQPALTAERFVPDPREPGRRLYRTGDLAVFEPGGEIAFVGRMDDQVKIRGVRLELDEIAVVLSEHPGVRAAAVRTWDTGGEHRLAAYVVHAPGEAPTEEALRAFLGARLPVEMTPAAFALLDALPLTVNGKVDRAALPAPALATELAAPRTPIEEHVAALVAELLRLERVGIDQNFFLLGGHSLLGAQLIARIRALYGVELTLQGLFDNPTVASMSTEIERLVVERLEAMTDEEAERLLA